MLGRMLSTTPPVTLRPATAADHAFMLSLAPRLVATLPEWRDAGAALKHYDGLFREVLALPDTETGVLIAEQAGRPVGFTVLYLLADEQATFIKDFAVTEDAAGTGVAQVLMEAARSWARDRGCRELSLKTGWDNGRARAFYGREGFQSEYVMMVQTLE